MKKVKRLFYALLTIVTVVSCFGIEAFALTEAEVQSQVDAVGKDAVTGNILIWFLCAIAFLKVSQKIDSFMSSLGINVGHTGGSMLSELMLAARGISMAGQISGHGTSTGGGNSSGDSGAFLQGGLAGVVSRGIENNAMNNATGATDGGIGGMAYRSSVGNGGGFANHVIGNIANGRISTHGSITGDNASQALMSYLGYTAMGEGAEDVPSFSNVEIGGGRITATETSAEHPEGIAIGMYSADQYMAPEGNYTTVIAADGSSWYKQYAADTVERSPYAAEDGSVAYHESIVKKLPRIPSRKDRV